MNNRTSTVSDPISREVIRNRLESIVREMAEVTLRTARSAVVYTGRDFSCGILTKERDLLAVGTSIPIHIFPIIWQVNLTVAKFQETIEEGDIFIGNDPYDGGTHLNDVLIFMPVFFRGQLVAYAANRAHWYDVGGMVPGSISGNAREIYQEGLRIPPMQIGSHGTLNEEILQFILKNVRVPDQTRGDIFAQVASCKIAIDRIQGLLARYEPETAMQHWTDILDLSERRMRMIIQSLPDGSSCYEGYLDNDGVSKQQRVIRVNTEIANDTIHVDYSGSAEESQGPLNVSEVLAHCFAFMGVKASLDPEGSINSGSFRPISVTAPKHSMLNASEPSPAAGMAELGQASIFVMQALSNVAPRTVSAGEGAGANHQNLFGIDNRQAVPKRYIYYDYPGGGGGGRYDKDGLDFVRSLRSGNVNIQPVEVLESLFPIRFNQYELRKNSGGPGQFRGGMGVVREYTIPSSGTISFLGDHAIVPATGLSQGHPGLTAKWELIRSGKSRLISPRFHSKATGFSLSRSDIIRISTQGGGGYGDPLLRSPNLVLQDYLEDKISLDHARAKYGVVLDGIPPTINLEETNALRTALDKKKLTLDISIKAVRKFSNGVRVGYLNIPTVNPTLSDRALVQVYLPEISNPVVLRIIHKASLPANTLQIDEQMAKLFLLTKKSQIIVQPLE